MYNDMNIKTYGVSELTEWHGKIKAGSLEVSLSFRGGTSSPSGAQPAYYVTKDPITQFVIENSKEFKNGFIMLLMNQETAGSHPRMGIRKSQPTRSFVAESDSPSYSETAADEIVSAEDAENSGNVEVVETDCFQDAVAYLQENFGIASYKVRSFEIAQKMGLEHGVRFTGGKFDTLKIE